VYVHVDMYVRGTTNSKHGFLVSKSRALACRRCVPAPFTATVQPRRTPEIHQAMCSICFSPFPRHLPLMAHCKQPDLPCMSAAAAAPTAKATGTPSHVVLHSCLSAPSLIRLHPPPCAPPHLCLCLPPPQPIHLHGHQLLPLSITHERIKLTRRHAIAATNTTTTRLLRLLVLVSLLLLLLLALLLWPLVCCDGCQLGW